jgi:hypothetical protein
VVVVLLLGDGLFVAFAPESDLLVHHCFDVSVAFTRSRELSFDCHFILELHSWPPFCGIPPLKLKLSRSHSTYSCLIPTPSSLPSVRLLRSCPPHLPFTTTITTLYPPDNLSLSTWLLLFTYLTITLFPPNYTCNISIGMKTTFLSNSGACFLAAFHTNLWTLLFLRVRVSVTFILVWTHP